jgi:hypothetical protein
MSSRTAVAVVLAVSLPLPIQAHDIYTHLLDGRGKSCCNDKDCRPAHYRVTSKGLQMFVDGRWIDVPSGAIQYLAIPGDTGETRRGHWCGGSAYERNFSSPDDGLYLPKCAVLPPQSASADPEGLGVSGH